MIGLDGTILVVVVLASYYVFAVRDGEPLSGEQVRSVRLYHQRLAHRVPFVVTATDRTAVGGGPEPHRSIGGDGERAQLCRTRAGRLSIDD